jgi:hypothetical protein
MQFLVLFECLSAQDGDPMFRGDVVCQFPDQAPTPPGKHRLPAPAETAQEPAVPQHVDDFRDGCLIQLPDDEVQALTPCPGRRPAPRAESDRPTVGRRR